MKKLFDFIIQIVVVSIFILVCNFLISKGYTFVGYFLLSLPIYICYEFLKNKH